MQVDFDGAFEYSPVITVLAEISRIEIDLYPNPASRQLNVRFNTDAELATVSLVNAAGVIMHQQQAALLPNQRQIELDVSNLEAGVYILMLNINGKLTQHRVIIKR